MSILKIIKYSKYNLKDNINVSKEDLFSVIKSSSKHKNINIDLLNKILDNIFKERKSLRFSNIEKKINNLSKKVIDKNLHSMSEKEFIDKLKNFSANISQNKSAVYNYLSGSCHVFANEILTISKYFNIDFVEDKWKYKEYTNDEDDLIHAFIELNLDDKEVFFDVRGFFNKENEYHIEDNSLFYEDDLFYSEKKPFIKYYPEYISELKINQNFFLESELLEDFFEFDIDNLLEKEFEKEIEFDLNKEKNDVKKEVYSMEYTNF